MAISSREVMDLRKSTGAGVMDCKRALTQSGGDVDEAVKWLREKGIAKAAKRMDRVAAEGAVHAYIHMGGKIGVLVEVNCETDFVARADEFKNFIKDICLQICSTAPIAISREDVPKDILEPEKAVFVKQAQETGKPDKICEKIAAGKLDKWLQEVCLLDQPFVKDNDRTISDLLAELTDKVREKIQIRRFVRFQLGEGIAKRESNLAEEVAAELKKAEAKKG